jgi:broad specificity phosphatase PhoE
VKNEYFLARHGHSLANEAGTILSDPEAGTTAFGLTEKGKTQVRASAEAAKESGMLDETALIISSDFTRARETAEIIAEVLGVSGVIFSEKLRERYFGDWERKSNSHYQDVWDEDVKDSSHTHNNVESVDAVRARATELIRELEGKHFGKVIILVSHGDALQILQTAFENVPGSAHRLLPHLGTAEIRKVVGVLEK